MKKNFCALIVMVLIGLFLLSFIPGPVQAVTWPSAPPDFKVKIINSTSVYLDWGVVYGAESYSCYVSTQYTGPWDVQYPYSGFLTQTHETVIGLDDPKVSTYYFTVCAWNELKDGSLQASSLSPVLSAAPQSLTPANIGVASKEYDTLQVTWNVQPTIEGSEVRRSLDNMNWSTAVEVPSGTSYVDGGLSSGTRYYYQVRSYNLIRNGDGVWVKNYSDWSSSQSGIPIPAASTTVSAKSQGFDTLQLSWNAVAGADYFRIERKTSLTGAWSYAASVPGSKLYYTHSGLTCGSLNYYRIQAYRFAGKDIVYGEWSATFTGTPIPSKPLNLQVITAGYDSLSLDWDAVAGASGYRVRRATSYSGMYSTVATLIGSASAHVDGGLETGKIYYYQVSAFTAVPDGKVYINVYGDGSNIASNKTIPAKVTNLNVDSMSSSTLHLKWSPVEGADGYAIDRAGSSVGPWSHVQEYETDTQFYDTELTAGYPYYYRVRAYCIVKDSPLVYGIFSDIKYGSPQSTSTPTPYPGSTTTTWQDPTITVSPGISPSVSPGISPVTSQDNATGSTTGGSQDQTSSSTAGDGTVIPTSAGTDSGYTTGGESQSSDSTDQSTPGDSNSTGSAGQQTVKTGRSVWLTIGIVAGSVFLVGGGLTGFILLKKK